MDESTIHYTVLARRFRPQAFDEVIGQQNVAQALRNAIASGRVAHAYLFTGARGVGKTSMARILAKALNCPHARDGVPCNACEICRGIAAGNDVDIQEIDGASNRGIDDVRALRANVGVKSMRTKYKIYIIDEVHMLSKDAFNALLKTLEEPPPFVIFVFCTTEPTKIPDTILSRCQRFDFSTIELASIVARLKQIAEAEGFRVEPAALELVARRAAGSMRDSQSLFDQLLAFGRDPLTADDVHQLLGTASDDRLIALAQALIDGRADTALAELDSALAAGVQLGELVDQFLNYLRDLMVQAAGAENVGLLAVAGENRDAIAGQANAWGLQTILAALAILAEAKTRMFRSTTARALVESAFVRIALLDDLADISTLIAQLKQGESAAAGPSERAMPPATAAAGSAPSKRSAPVTPPIPAPARSDAGTPASGIASTDAAGVKKNDAVEKLVTTAAAEAAGTLRRIDLVPGNEGELWSEVVGQIHDVLKDHLRTAAVAISGPNQLVLTFSHRYNFSKQYCERPDSLSRLEELASRVASRQVRVAIRIDPEEQPGPTASARRHSEPTLRSDPTRSRPLPELINDPFVQQVQAVFEATVVKVEGLPDESHAHE